MAHVLSVVPRLPHPAFSGGELRVRELIRRLSGEHRFTLLLLAEEHGKLQQAALSLELERELGVSVRLVARQGGRAGQGPAMTRGHDDPAMARAVLEALDAGGVDLVHVEFTQMGRYVSAVGGRVPVVYTEHDAGILSPFGSYLRPEGRLRGLGQWAASVAYLRGVLSACDRVVAVSEADARRLSRLMPAERLRVVPTGVDLDAFPFAGLEGREHDSLVFVGHYPHYPNEDAAVRLCREVLPELRALVPGARVRLVGSQPTPAVEALAGSGVEVVGTVPCVAPHLARARVFLAPMRLGRGIKGKILEALAAGAPVVATPAACEAMPGLRDGEHVLLAPSSRGLAACAARLLLDPALSARLAEAGRAYVSARFGWEAQARLMSRVYGEALAGRPGP